MKYKFWKYQGTGNDFIFFDGREDVSLIKGNKNLIAELCDRRFGIGADGLIILEEDVNSDFNMLYYNSDGGASTMCGNGGRCSIAFSKLIGLSDLKTQFEAVDGTHSGVILENGWVKLGMISVDEIKTIDKHNYIINTGSPHYVRVLEEGEEVDIVEFGRSIRYSDEFKMEGINVNTIKVLEDGIRVETYERGVEDETFSCGTGVTACAIVYEQFASLGEKEEIEILTKGGRLSVSFSKSNGRYHNILLSGPATMVFEGEIDL